MKKGLTYPFVLKFKQNYRSFFFKFLNTFHNFRDALYRLSLRGLRQLERADWSAPADKAKFCQDKGQSEDDCHNYIKVLLMYKDKLFACGTNAFSPMCTWREVRHPFVTTY